jgi:hypothetical protein
VAQKRVLEYVKGKKLISLKINLNLVAGNVFDRQNEFHENRTRFGGFMESKKLSGLF